MSHGCPRNTGGMTLILGRWRGERSTVGRGVLTSLPLRIPALGTAYRTQVCYLGRLLTVLATVDVIIPRQTVGNGVTVDVVRSRCCC